MNKQEIESVIFAMEVYVGNQFDPPIDLVESWAKALENAIKDDEA